MNGARVCICVTTYRRPDALKRLLDGIARLVVPKELNITVSVVVVDNDPRGSAEPIVLPRLGGVYPYPLIYTTDARRGISYARNRAISIALPRADWVAFIDDDEVPEPEWLTALVRAQREYSADAVAGPVLPVFPEDAPQWVLRGGFFDREPHRAGESLPYANTGNCLIRTSCFRSFMFDESLGLSGGEDTLFFMQLKAAGGRIVWAPDAVVHETVPAERISGRWLLRRSFRKGTVWTHCESRISPGLLTRVRRLTKAIARIGRGLLSLPVSAGALGRAGIVRSMQDVMVGLGNLVGLSGFRYQEYRDAGS